MRHIVILVHGTWARDASFASRGSRLCQALVGALGPDTSIVPFQWSGRNTISARSRASRELADLLHAVLLKEPSARPFVIGHSHGGNVALYALQDKTLSERVAGVVCLATPFLHAQRRAFRVSPSLSFLPMLLLSAILIWSTFWRGRSGTLAGDLGWMLMSSLMLLAVALFCLVVTMVLVPWYESFASRVVTQLAVPSLRKDTLLILRAPADEATAALTTVHFVQWLFDSGWRIVANAMDRVINLTSTLHAVLDRYMLSSWGIVSVLVLGLAFWRGVVPSQPLWILPVSVALWIWISLLVIALVVNTPIMAALLVGGVLAIPCIVLPSIVVLPFGPELVVASILVRVSVEAAPAGEWVVTQLGAEQSSSMAHARVYEDDAALQLIEEWLRTRAAVQDAATA